MCFYEQHIYQCRDWKWGEFRQHCQSELRTGEACGSKMIYQTNCLQGKCKMCLKIEAKQRRRAKHVEDYDRWRQEPRRYQESIEKILQDIKELEKAIAAILTDKHEPIYED